MDKILEFLNKRVEFLRGFEEDEDDETIDGEEIYSRGEKSGKFKEAVFIRNKVKKMIENQ